MRTIASAARPGAVAGAKMVSELEIMQEARERELHLSLSLCPEASQRGFPQARA
jgi:hypothetical protein